MGPIIGGIINTELGMAKTCNVMGQIGVGTVFLYLVFSFWVWCTVHEENDLRDLNISMRDEDEEQEHFDVQFLPGRSTR